MGVANVITKGDVDGFFGLAIDNLVQLIIVVGLGTIFASLFGSCFPTTIYIGHPGWKAMGARFGYSILKNRHC